MSISSEYFPGGSIAKQDKIIKKTIENIVEKENLILEQYKKLLGFKSKCPESMKGQLDKLLEEKRIFLAYKMQSKENQCSAFMKLLEYINTLNTKQKNLESKLILNKINDIEKELQPLKEILI